MSQKERQNVAKYSKEDKLKAVMLIKECNNNASRASRICGIPRTTLLKWQNQMKADVCRDPELQEVEAEVIQHLENVRREFLEKHYQELNNTFGLAIHKTREALMNVKNPPSAMAAITVAEKLAGIIKDFAVAEEVGVETGNLLQLCIARIEE